MKNSLLVQNFSFVPFKLGKIIKTTKDNTVFVHEKLVHKQTKLLQISQINKLIIFLIG